MTRTRIALVALLALIIGGGALLGREATLLWVGDRVQANGNVALEHLTGSLLGGIHVDRLHWQGAQLEVAASDVTLAWAPWWLLAGKLAFHRADAATLDITRRAPPDGRSGVPDELHVPWRLRFDNATVATLRYAPPAGAAEVYSDVGFALDFGARAWKLQLRRLQTRWGRLEGKGSIATQAPHAAKASLSLLPEGHAASVPPVAIQASADGTIDALAVRVKVTAQTSVAEATMQVSPMAPQPVRAIDAFLRGFDPHHLGDALPAATLDGHLAAATGPDDVLRGHLAIDNRTPGLLNDGRLPLTSLQADLGAAPGRWRLDSLRLDFGGAGALAGSGSIGADDATLQLATSALDLSGLHAALRPTRLAGTLTTDGPRDAQRVRLTAHDGAMAFALDATANGERIDIARARASAGGGSAEVSGTLALNPDHAFSGKVALRNFNPAAFGKYPQASLNGALSANGALAPVLQVRAEGSLAASRLFGLPASGRGKWISRGTDDPAITLDVTGEVGATNVKARGTITDPRDLRALDLDLVLSGKNMAELYTLTGLPFPVTADYQLNGHLDFRDRTWTLHRFKGQVGRSDLAGDFSVDLRRERPFMKGNLVSERLDLRDLGGFIGAGGAPANGAPDRVLAQNNYQIDRLNAADADIQFTGRTIRNESLPLHRMSAHLVLDHGQVTLRPLDFNAAGGELSARITMDARRAPIRTVADVQARGLQLNRIAPGVKAATESAGTVDARTRLAMEGSSVAAMLGSADGNLVLAMNGGSMSDLVLRLANLDIANSLIALARGNRTVPIRCLVADFTAKDGVLYPRTMVLDTEHTVIHGEGHINLRTESLALRLVAEPKDGSLFALRGPIRVDGTLGKPGLHPELSGLAARSGAAIALGIVATPLAAVLPFLQKGKQQDIDCEPLILDASRFIRNGEPSRPVETAAAAANAPAVDQKP
ncbi:MAG: AsmA family protein [Betaproteobacteria bacterium]